ncbi:MAG: hypothetical protein A4E63_02841 [Syntrophorhabdus sp. PtaU1.Bin050]|nr:MAG: hypothetical protein A4E63_02841 [Syntrophorhabdus sp. PtaU1.Bin050]
MLLLLILIVAGAAKLWTTIGHSGIQCRATINTNRVFPEGRLDLGLTVKNNVFLPLWCQMEIPLHGLLCRTSGGDAATPLTAEASLLRHSSGRFQWELTARHRGVFRAGPIHLTSGDLFGFFPKERDIEDVLEIVVYPRLVPLKPVSITRRDFFGIPGDESPVRDPVYILGTHDYQHGRPARFIHWKASARRHVLQEKVFEPTEQEKVLFVVGVEGFAGSGASYEFERSLEAVASLAVSLDRQGIAMGLVTDAVLTGKAASVRAVKRDPGRLEAILETLARSNMEKRQDLLEGLRQNGGLPFGVTCLYFSYGQDETSQAVKEYFRRRRIPVIHYVCSLAAYRSAVPHAGSGRAVRSLDEILVSDTGKEHEA